MGKKAKKEGELLPDVFVSWHPRCLKKEREQIEKPKHIAGKEVSGWGGMVDRQDERV